MSLPLPLVRPTLETRVTHLRVLIANEERDRLELLAQVVFGLGHDVIAREIDLREVGAVTVTEHPDVALVGLGSSSEDALEVISEIVQEAFCPVIAILHNGDTGDNAYIHEAAKRGVFAYILDGTPDQLQSAIDITLQRFSEYQNLQGAFGRRALIEQARGILMARHSVDADRAFEMLRDHSRRNGRKLSDFAADVVESPTDRNSPADTGEDFSPIWTAFDAGDILPACAWCGRVQIDDAWLVPPPAAVAAVDQRYTFSHSICNVCASVDTPALAD